MAGDPNWSDVSLLLKCDTDFTDSSPRTKTVTVDGPTIGTTRYKWGGGSGSFNTAGSLTIPGDTDFNFGSGAFTVEFWYYKPASVAQFTTFFDTGSQGFSAQYGSDPADLLFVVNTGTVITAAHGMSDSAWHHIAFVRHAGNTADIFVDGVSIGSASGLSAHNDATTVYIGEYSGGGYELNGDLDSIRVTKGVARYTSTFTPPTAEFYAYPEVDILADSLDDTVDLSSEFYGDLAIVTAIANSVVNLETASSAFQSITPETLESFVGLSDAGLEPEVGPLTLANTANFTEVATADHSTTPGLSALTLASSFVAQLDVTGVPLISSVLFESDVGSMQWASASDTVTLVSVVNGALAADELDSAVVVQSTLGPAVIVAASLEHAVVLVDAIGHGFMAGELDSAVAFTSIFSGNLALIALPLNSALAFSETAAAVLGLMASSDSALVLTDALSGQLALLGAELASYVQLTDAARAGALQLMLVLNAETGAVSTYSMTPEVAGMAAIDGVLVLACADGLYALDADTDASGAVAWTLKTGFSTLGSEYLKRVQDIDVLCQTDGDLIATLTSGRYGQKQSYTYRLEPLTRDANRDGVIHVGKGVHSVNWQLELQGIGPTEIDSTILTVEPLSRRR